MSLIGLIVVLVILGVGLYLLGMVPMDGNIRRVIYVLTCLFVFLWVIQSLGIFHTGVSLR
jgi:hypothetical protein